MGSRWLRLLVVIAAFLVAAALGPGVARADWQCYYCGPAWLTPDETHGSVRPDARYPAARHVDPGERSERGVALPELIAPPIGTHGVVVGYSANMLGETVVVGQCV